MKTHILNKMRNIEVEEYLDRGKDVVFIPEGTVELHGDLPLDCETIYVEAIAERDELALNGSKMIDDFVRYFNPQQVIDGLNQIDLATQEHIIPRYPHLK